MDLKDFLPLPQLTALYNFFIVVRCNFVRLTQNLYRIMGRFDKSCLCTCKTELDTLIVDKKN